MLDICATSSRNSGTAPPSWRVQVNFLALAAAPDLARAAREELWALEAKEGGADEAEAALHAADLERQQAAIQSIDTDARKESAVNKVWAAGEGGGRKGRLEALK